MLRRSRNFGNKPKGDPDQTAEAATGSFDSKFEAIFVEYAPFVWRVLGRLGVQQRDLSDASQEVFIVVHRRLGDFEGRSSLRTWIYAICTRVARNFERRRRRLREHDDGNAPDLDDGTTPHSELERKRSRQLLALALDELSQEQREVFVFYELEELNMTEIAELLACPPTTAYSRLHAARRSIRATFARKSLAPRRS